MIEIAHLTKHFNDAKNLVVALEDVNLEIFDGDVFGVIGMSGAGKSTLLRCLSMLEEPTEGKIVLNGTDTSHLKGKELIAARRNMGVVFQGYNLLMQKSVRDNIAFGLALERMPKQKQDERVDELLKIVGLEDKKFAYPSQLSGGQKQRVAIARALATNPSVLLCDEPTSALDSFTTKAMLELLKEINKKLNVTIVIITHEMSVVKAICNRVAVIEASRIVEVGETKAVFENPQSDSTRLLLGNEVIEA